METIKTDNTLLKGWGVDSNLQNDPTYPMRHRTEASHAGFNWERPRQQPLTVEILKSNEYKTLPAVFGTSCPPSGLSGMIRRFAFRYSEGSFAHWLPLVFADRVNVVEGIFEDISKGKFPNLFLEKGGRARWKYNRGAIFVNAAVGVGLLAATLSLLFRKRAAEV